MLGGVFVIDLNPRKCFAINLNPNSVFAFRKKFNLCILKGKKTNTLLAPILFKIKIWLNYKLHLLFFTFYVRNKQIQFKIL